MDRIKMLSGAEIVAKAAAKLETSLPELGLKDVLPNGSWLEKKQIQTALEARKHLVESQRIEKSAVLSRADWREDMRLAEVTHKVGGHWQFFGHNKWNHLYLYPEEALILMEMNCLQLRFNDVPVPLQQAYSLLLQEPITILKYKVYASLTRIGYKVFRHRISQTEDVKPNNSDIHVDDNTKNDEHLSAIPVIDKGDVTMEDTGLSCSTVEEYEGKEIKENSLDLDKKKQNTQPVEAEICIKETTVGDTGMKQNNQADIDFALQKTYSEGVINENTQRLIYKQFQICNTKDIHKYFEAIPNLCQKTVVTIPVPESRHLPSNINFNKASYVIDIGKVKVKSAMSPTEESSTYNITHEGNTNFPRIRNTTFADWNVNNNRLFPRLNPFYPTFNQFRTRQHLNFIPFPLLLQRSYLPNMYNLNQSFQPRSNYPMFFRSQFPSANLNTSYARNNGTPIRKRNRNNTRQIHLEAIKRLSVKLKRLYFMGNDDPRNVQLLQKLIQTYNSRYGASFRLSNDFEIIENDRIVETIELDDEEETPTKKRRQDIAHNGYERHFNKLRQITLKLKKMETCGKSISRYKRALSNTIKTFNRLYTADVHLSDNLNVSDRSFINLNSSSDSDCVIEEVDKKTSKNTSKRFKKLRNPFSILSKRNDLLSATDLSTPSTSKHVHQHTRLASDFQHQNTRLASDFQYSDFILKTFHKNWLPNQNDFGRAEVVPKKFFIERLMDINNAGFMLDFLKSQSSNWNNWAEVKLAFRKSLEETTSMLENETTITNNLEYNSIIKPEDCTDTTSILNKLKIIETHNDTACITSLSVDFDVYYRDVSNFKKTNPPKPHLRMICVDESSSFPSGSDVTALKMKYKDNVPIVFAIVSAGSISYLQINPTDTPVYIPNNQEESG